MDNSKLNHSDIRDCDEPPSSKGPNNGRGDGSSGNHNLPLQQISSFNTHPTAPKIVNTGKKVEAHSQQQPPIATLPPSMSLSLSTNAPGCTCKKSRCLKLYCQCFASSALCDSTKCKCASCKNFDSVQNVKDIKRARSIVLYRNPRAFEAKFRDDSNGGRDHMQSKTIDGNPSHINSVGGVGRNGSYGAQMTAGKLSTRTFFNSTHHSFPDIHIC